MAKKNIYCIDNPWFLADTFVFSEVDGYYVFIKINNSNKIEDIGSDISKRMSTNIHSIIENAAIANRLQASIFRRIDKEYWWKLINKNQ